jgi:hypothetical protein
LFRVGRRFTLFAFQNGLSSTAKAFSQSFFVITDAEYVKEPITFAVKNRLVAALNNCELSFVTLYYRSTHRNRLESFPVPHRFTDRRSILRLTAATFYLALTVPVLAQRPAPPVDRSNTDRQRQQDMSKREYQLRNFGVTRNGAVDDRQMKAVVAQVEQDFSRILLLHNQIARALSSDEVLDDRFVSDATGEIKKRSTRLQSTLALRQTDEDKSDSNGATELDQVQVKPALVSLCKHIRDFVTNPVIETPGTIDAKYLAKARSDLADIISLSGLIRRQIDQTRHSTTQRKN